MKKFTTNDLLFKDYQTAKELNDNPCANPSDSTYLNKAEAYKMAYFINGFMVKNNINDVRTGQKVEAFIKRHPRGKMTHKAWNTLVTFFYHLRLKAIFSGESNLYAIGMGGC